MKCPKCKKKLPKNTKFCSYCGTPIKKKSFKVISIILVITILLASVGIIGYKFDLFKSHNTIIKDGDFIALNYQFTDKKITSAEEAIDVVSEISDTLGFDNALDELSVKATDKTVNGDNYYRLQQNYKGIPVYGRTAIATADISGNAKSLTTNVIDIKSNIDISQTIDKSVLENMIKKYFKENYCCENIELLNLNIENKVIYTLKNGKECLAYEIFVLTEKGLYNAYVDIENSTVIDVLAETKSTYQTASSTLQGQRELFTNIDISNQDNTNFLYDIGRKIRTQELETNTEKIGGFLFIEYYDNVITGEAQEISWNSSETLNNSNAADTYVNTQISYDYFSKVLNNTSTDGQGNAIINTFTNYGYFHNIDENDNDFIDKSFDNAFSSSYIDESGNLITQLVVCNKKSKEYTMSTYLDVMAHEYTHSVNAWHNDLIYKGESGAIDEALADIYGELVESWHYGEIDWKNIFRDYREPSNTGNPSTYKTDKNWIDTSNPTESNDNGGVHRNSTVLSHSAYLMWYGIDGDSKKNLNETELAELWYRSLLMLPADASFSDCRTIVEMSAEQMGLSNHQRKCVSEAFDRVGITRSDSITYVLKNKFDLTVNDINGKSYSDYTILIDNEKNIENVGVPHSVELSNGIHTLTIVDKSDENKKYTFTVNVSNSDEARDYVNINSDFGKLEDENNEEENINKEITIDTSYPTTYDESSMKYQRMVAKDENYTFMKDLNGKLERKNNNGSAGDKVLYDEEFFTICGIDASYIYLLKGIEKDGVYDIVRISKDGKKIDTLLQSINWCLHMDSDYFYYVPNDNNKCIRRLNRAKITSDNYCEFNEPVEVLIPQDNNFMVVTKEDSIFALFGGATNNFYLIDKNGTTIKEYGSEITVEEYPREKIDDGGYNTAIKYVSNGYLRSTAAEVYLQYGGSFINAEGISGWNPTKNGIVTTLNNDADGENALPYKIMLYDATSGGTRKMTEAHSNQAFFTICQDDNGDWCYIDEVDNKLILYSLSSNLDNKEIITEIDAGKFNCSLETCGMEIMDNRIYFYSMPDNKTANAIYRYDLILED